MRPASATARRAGWLSLLQLFPNPVGDLSAAADSQDHEVRQASGPPVEENVVPRAVIALFGQPRFLEFLLVGPPATSHNLSEDPFDGTAILTGGGFDLM